MNYSFSMSNWEHFRYFLKIHEHGSLKAAARALGVDQTTVGRNLNAFEEALGLHLFERRQSGFVLTTAGSRILGEIRTAEDALLNAERLILGKDERQEGIVKVAIPGALANHWLLPRLKDFFSRFPRVQLELLTGPEVLNLLRREADLAIRLVKPSQKELISKRMGTLKLGLFTHRSRSGAVREQPFIGLYPHAISDPEAALLKSLGLADTKPAIRSAAWSSVFCAIKAGLGAGILPLFMAEKERDLIRLSPEKEATIPLWLVYHPDLKNAARVRAVIEFVSRF